ncbi:hypothetical protein OH460_07730 [Vibrio sp. Makdt]|uniref:hypothetical protein n=1 Tax=Vibrio sp. Makdt TaxID=2998828 RepID=UPI0022CDA6F2|nr:hypothetical protein [Vibrio sp. Makdt]MDA0152186.1 hypothetical protein [Vibrio sp. Makdt]
MDTLTNLLWVPGIGVSFCVVLWAAFKSKHNRIIASLAVLSLTVSIAVFNFVPNLLEHDILKWVCFGSLFLFFIFTVSWMVLDLSPKYMKIYRKIR